MIISDEEMWSENFDEKFKSYFGVTFLLNIWYNHHFNHSIFILEIQKRKFLSNLSACVIFPEKLEKDFSSVQTNWLNSTRTIRLGLLGMVKAREGEEMGGAIITKQLKYIPHESTRTWTRHNDTVDPSLFLGPV